jgi:hypothetical protein
MGQRWGGDKASGWGRESKGGVAVGQGKRERLGFFFFFVKRLSL